MVSEKQRSRQTVKSIFFLALRLMCKEPPLCAFRCGFCQDKDGRYRVVTADGIWLGYPKRLESGSLVQPTVVVLRPMP